ncbi:hypothetical protein PR048_023890 [Dryococelus australis]|uniref:Transposase Tc1-like domain-containing protein n=1 Tax=Dryococelus australis TaxID=614101 RepID=A0ABQ9GVC8_9NEOP|nr:hypothetical protein PR048_023890 [Dryococelus australis]
MGTGEMRITYVDMLTEWLVLQETQFVNEFILKRMEHLNIFIWRFASFSMNVSHVHGLMVHQILDPVAPIPAEQICVMGCGLPLARARLGDWSQCVVGRQPGVCGVQAVLWDTHLRRRVGYQVMVGAILGRERASDWQEVKCGMYCLEVRWSSGILSIVGRHLIGGEIELDGASSCCRCVYLRPGGNVGFVPLISGGLKWMPDRGNSWNSGVMKRSVKLRWGRPRGLLNMFLCRVVFEVENQYPWNGTYDVECENESVEEGHHGHIACVIVGRESSGLTSLGVELTVWEGVNDIVVALRAHLVKVHTNYGRFHRICDVVQEEFQGDPSLPIRQCKHPVPETGECFQKRTFVDVHIGEADRVHKDDISDDVDNNFLDSITNLYNAVVVDDGLKWTKNGNNTRIKTETIHRRRVQMLELGRSSNNDSRSGTISAIMVLDFSLFLITRPRAMVVLWFRLHASQQGEPGSIPGGVSFPDFRTWESCRTMPLVSSGISNFPPLLHSGISACSLNFTLICSRDLAARSRCEQSHIPRVNDRVTCPVTIEEASGSNFCIASRLGCRPSSDLNVLSSANSNAGMKGQGKRKIPKKTRRSALPSGTTPTCENPGATPPGIEPNFLRLEASSLTTSKNSVEVVIFGYNRNELLDFDNSVIAGCHLSGLPSLAIARKVYRPKSTVAFVLRKWKVDGHSANAALSVLPPILTDRNRRTLKGEIVKNRAQPMATIQQEFHAATGVTVHRHGYFARAAAHKLHITTSNKARRLRWCLDRRNWTLEQWKSVPWSDESRFTLFRSDGRVWVWRLPEERPLPECIVSTRKFGSGGVMVWGCFTAFGVGPLVFVQGSMNT